MEFKILGSVEVVGDAGRLSLGGPQQRKLLAVLLCDPGQTLTFTRLLEVLWPDGEPPDNSRRTAISYVSRLRSALGEGWIVTTDAGYSIDIAAASVDSIRFAALVESARGLPPDRAVDVLDEALALWRGPVFGDLHAEWWALPTVSRLGELRLSALADRIDAMSSPGWNARALAEVKALVSQHPLRGPFVERLMRGLNATGRTDEALRAFQQHRDDLIERTGLAPSADLVSLDRSIAAEGRQSTDGQAPGRALRGYVLRDVIGEGSFGTVYRATQPLVGRDVAVKVIKSDLADDRSFIHRFEAEAQVVARLEHPHIVPLYDFWREPGGAYLVFRLLRGGTGEDALVRQGQFTLEHATHVLEQIGGALTSAHAAGVVHRDVKPANILFDDDGSAYLSDFGIATGEDPASGGDGDSAVRRSAGSPMYASPEQSRDGVADARADQYALAATVWELLTGRAPFEGATAAEVIHAKLQSPLASLRSVRDDVPSRADEVLKRASAVHPDDRFGSVAEFVGAWAEAISARLTSTTAPDDLATSLVRADGASATSPLITGHVANPYKGLRPFGEADANEFFGRTALLDQLREMVGERRFTAVVGPSGSGKSSLVLAGLVPLMKREGALVITCTPGDDPFAALSDALSDVATVEQAPVVTADALRMPGGLVHAATALVHEDPLIVVLDQLEELWTTTDQDERTGFARELARLAASSSAVRIVATVRADWFDRPLRDPSLGPLVARATFGVTPMQATELYEAITDPAARVGVRFEAGLVGRIVAEALDQPGSLPLLQFALTELFDARSGATITTQSYDDIGGLSGSVAHQADALFATFDATQQASVRRLFARLVTAGEGSEDTRRRARRSEIAGVSETVVTALVDRRLLTVDRDRDTREPSIEIAHEALLRSWPLLREWLEEDRDWLRELRGLSVAARLWGSSGCDDADLYRGARLAVVSEMAKTRGDALTPDEAEFVETSQRLADAERVAAEERARSRERQNRQLRRSLVGLGMVVIVALIAGGIALVQSHRADQKTAEAEQQAALAADRSADADAQRAIAEASETDANTQRAAAEESATVAESAQRTSAIENLVNTSILQRSNRQDLSALLAIEAYRIDQSAAKSALFSTFTRNIGFMGYRTVAGTAGISSLAPLPGSRTALAGLDNGTLVEVDLDTGAVLRTFGTVSARGDQYFATILQVSDDGTIAVFAVQGTDSLMWQSFDVVSGRAAVEPVEVPFAQDRSQSAANVFQGFGDASLSPDGSLFAIGGGSLAGVRVFDTRTGTSVASVTVPVPVAWSIPAHTVSLLFAPDGALYVGTVDGDIQIFDPASAADGGTMSQTGLIHAPRWSVEYGLRYVGDPDGDYLITHGAGEISRVDLDSQTVTWTNLSGSENALLENGTPTDGLNPCRALLVIPASRSNVARILCADDFGAVFARSVDSGDATGRVYDRQSGVPGPLALTSNGKELLATSYGNNTIASWRLDGSGPIQQVIAADTGSIAVLGYDSTSTYLMSAISYSQPALLNAETGESTPLPPEMLIGKFSSVPGQVWSAFVDGGVLVGGLYDMNVGGRVGPPMDFHGVIPIPLNDPAHHRLLARYEYQVEVYGDDGTYIGPTITVPDVAGATTTSAWETPDGTMIGISRFGEGTHLYDATSGDELPTESEPGSPVLVVTDVSPNGVGVGSTLDGHLYLFDPYTLDVIDELPGVHGYAENLSLSLDGTLLVAENEGDGLRLYDVASRRQIGDAIPDVDGAVGYFSIRPDNKSLAIPYAKQGVVIWDLDPAHWLDAACLLAGRNLTQEEWARYIGDLADYHQTCVDGRANLGD